MGRHNRSLPLMRSFTFRESHPTRTFIRALFSWVPLCACCLRLESSWYFPRVWYCCHPCIFSTRGFHFKRVANGHCTFSYVNHSERAPACTSRLLSTTSRDWFTFWTYSYFSYPSCILSCLGRFPWLTCVHCGRYRNRERLNLLVNKLTSTHTQVRFERGGIDAGERIRAHTRSLFLLLLYSWCSELK